MKTFYAIVTTRNPESEEFKQTMASLNNQTVKPSEIVVIHDKEPTRDYSRIPVLWNRGIRVWYDYMLIMPDDVELEPTYCESILRRMSATPLNVIASGDVEPFNTQAPQGGGRFIQQKWFFEHYPAGFPHILGYESEILDRATRDGKYIWCWNDIHMVHLRQLGKHHNFSEFGQSMRSVGYHPLWALLRSFTIMQNPNVGVGGGLKTLYYYLTFIPDKCGYYSLWDKEYRSWLRQRTRYAFWIWVLQDCPRRFGQALGLLPPQHQPQ